MSKRGLVLGLLLVLAVVVVVFLVNREPAAPEVVPPTGDVVGAEPVAPEAPAGFQGEPGATAEQLVPAGGGEVPAPVEAGGALADVDPDAPPVVARGRVTWAAGTLPDDVDVLLYDSDGSDLDVTTAAADGSYELRWDEPLAAGWSVGTDSVTVAVNGQLLSLLPDNVDELPLHMPGQPPQQVDLVIGLPPVITGRVTDRITGAAIESAEIMAVSAQRAWALDECFALTEADGSYVLELEELPLRQIVVWCRVDDYQAQGVGPQDLAFAATPGEGLRIDFALDAPVPWRGRITSALDGLPVGDAQITVGNDLEAFADYFDFEISDDEGLFELELPDVPVEGAWVHVGAWDFAPAALRDVRPGQDLHIVLGAPVTLEGMVTGADGEPVDTAAVQVTFDGETHWGENGLYDEAFTDAEGAFEITLESAPGDASTLKVEAEGYATFEVRLADVATVAGAGRQAVKVSLTPSP